MALSRPLLSLIVLLGLSLVLLDSGVHAQTGLPDLPLDLDEGDVLFPQAIQYGFVDAGTSQTYIFVAEQNDDFTVTVTREGDNDLVPYLVWRSLDGSLRVEQAAGDLAGREAKISAFAPEDGWYYLDVGHDPASGKEGEISGAFSIRLTGTTSTIYRILDFGFPPILAADDRVLLHDRDLIIDGEAASRYYVPLRAQETLTVTPEIDWTLSLFNAAGVLQSSGVRTLHYTSEIDQWLRIDVSSAGDAGRLYGVVNGTPVAMFAGPLSSYLTLTPTVTVTATATATTTASPTTTATFTATPQPLDLSQTHIVFTCYVNGFDQVCMMNADGSNIQQLTSSFGTSWYATITQPGDQIVYSSMKSGQFEIYLMSTDGTEETRLTEGGDGYAPMLSPDGRQVVFAAKQQNLDQDIYVMNVDGSSLTRLTSAGGDDQDPVWSPDGRQILFSSDRSGQRNLWLMNADGSGAYQLTETGARGRSDWSPDGRYIAYYAGPRGGEEIYIITSEGRDMRQLTFGGSNKGPSFSPDSQWIAYASEVDGDNEIFIIRIDGTENQQLTFNSRPDYQPRWGP